jgi:hypothetical protein
MPITARSPAMPNYILASEMDEKECKTWIGELSAKLQNDRLSCLSINPPNLRYSNNFIDSTMQSSRTIFLYRGKPIGEYPFSEIEVRPYLKESILVRGKLTHAPITCYCFGFPKALSIPQSLASNDSQVIKPHGLVELGFGVHPDRKARVPF